MLLVVMMNPELFVVVLQGAELRASFPSTQSHHCPIWDAAVTPFCVWWVAGTAWYCTSRFHGCQRL